MRKRTQRGTLYRKDSWWYLRYSDFRVIDGQLQRKRLAKRLALLKGCSKRNSHISVTQACYIKTVSSDAVSAMQKLETALNDTRNDTETACSDQQGRDVVPSSES